MNQLSEKRFTLEQWTEKSLYFSDGVYSAHMSIEYICKKVEKKLNEQQATIRRLQDLCGESDGKNAKLRIENKRLQEENEKHIQKKCLPCELVNLQTREIDKLKDENEQLHQKNTKLISKIDFLERVIDGDV